MKQNLIKQKVMKIQSFILGIALLLFAGLTRSVNAQDSNKVTAAIEWVETTHDFGKIDLGKPVTVEFEFSNKSLLPLIINSVQPTCGCTVADYPKEPVQPGKSGKIVVTYNAASKGVFQKSILVKTNASDNYISLLIKGEVASL